MLRTYLARLFTRINGLLEDPENSTLLEWFGAFHDELKVSINKSINRDDAIYMMAAAYYYPTGF